VPPDGPTDAAVMVVGEAPGKTEIKQRRPLVGASGLELWEQLYNYALLPMSSCYITNTFLYPFERLEKSITPDEWSEARLQLYDDIRFVQPKVILSLGSIATHALLPEACYLNGDWYAMETMNALPHYYITPFGEQTSIIVVPSFHPAAAFRSSDKLGYLINACKALKEVLRGRLLPLPTPSPITLTPLSDHLTGPLIALDTEYRQNGSTIIVGASSAEGSASVTWRYEKSNLEKLARFCGQDSVTVLLHNALADLPALSQAGIRPRRWLDTMSIAFLVQYLPLGLKELAYRLGKRRMRTYEEVVGSYQDLACVPDKDSVNRYAGDDPEATLMCYKRMLSMWYTGMESILQLDMDVQPMILAMMQRGIKADKRFFANLDQEFEDKNFLRSLEIEEFAATLGFTTPVKSGKNKGKTFNPRSTSQLRELLYEKMNLNDGVEIKKTAIAGNLSTGRKYLARIKDKAPIVRLINDYKETATLRSNFVAKIPKFIARDGRVHTDFSMVRVLHSGRLASKNPNLLGIPVRSDDGRRIREGFIAPDGWTFISIDLSQIELRILAHISQDVKMLDVYRNGRDIHENTGMEIFKIKDPAMLDKYKHRIPSKTTNFLIANTGTASALSRELISVTGDSSWDIDRCQGFIDSWFRVYAGVENHLDKTARSIRNLGYIEDMFGRREYLPQVYSAFPRIAEEGIRIGCNQLIQAGAQGVMKTIMRNIWTRHMIEWITDNICYPLIQIHDNLVAEVRDDMVGYVGDAMMQEFETAAPWVSVPIKAEMEVGKTWGGLKEVAG
jgi:DNA polymerase I